MHTPRTSILPASTLPQTPRGRLNARPLLPPPNQEPGVGGSSYLKLLLVLKELCSCHSHLVQLCHLHLMKLSRTAPGPLPCLPPASFSQQHPSLNRLAKPSSMLLFGNFPTWCFPKTKVGATGVMSETTAVSASQASGRCVSYLPTEEGPSPVLACSRRPTRDPASSTRRPSLWSLDTTGEAPSQDLHPQVTLGAKGIKESSNTAS